MNIKELTKEEINKLRIKSYPYAIGENLEIMKTKLIKSQDKFILVSDEEIKEGCSIFETDQNNINIAGSDYIYSHLDKKIIAGIPELPSIDFSSLKEEECKKIGWVDVEKLAKLHRVNISSTWSKDSFIEGFKTAQSLNDKMFSLEDMVNFLDFVITNYPNQWKAYRARNNKGFYTSKELVSKFIQSLQQNVWDVEVEMEENQCDGCKSGLPISNGIHEDSQTFGLRCTKKRYSRPKITDFKIKITKIL